MLIVHFASGDLWAGAEVQLFTLVKYLNRVKKVNVKVILLNSGELYERLKNEGVDVVVFEESKYNAFQIYLKISSQLKLWKPNILHTHRQKENIIGGLASMLNGIRSIRTIHGAPESNFNWRRPLSKFSMILDQIVARYIQGKIISVSGELSIKLRKIYLKEKIITINNGVDLELIQAHQKSYSKKIKNNYITVGIVGRLVPVKQIELFINTAKILINKSNYKFKFLIYGDGPLKNSLSDQIQQLELDNNVSLMGHSSNILSCINDLDFLLITSKHEGLPITLLESLALGTPVISTDVGCISEVLKDETCGTIAHDNSPNGVASTLLICLANIEETKTKALCGKKHVLDHFSASKNADAYISVYNTSVKHS